MHKKSKDSKTRSPVLSVWRKYITVTFSRNLTDPSTNLDIVSCLTITQSIEKASCFLNFTPAVPGPWESFHSLVNTTHVLQKFPLFPALSNTKIPPAPQAPCRYLGNLPLFVLSRPFWTTFSLLIRAICSRGGETSAGKTISIPSNQQLLWTTLSAPAYEDIYCANHNSNYDCSLKIVCNWYISGHCLPLHPASGTIFLLLTEVFLKICSSLTKQLWVRSFSQEFYMWKTGH